MKNRQWLLARRPEGAIKDTDFDFVESEAPTPGEGEVLVRNTMLSCDPTQRGWIAFDTYLPAVKIGEVVRSIGAGRIVASNNPDFAVGDIVSGLVGWLDHVAMNSKGQLNKLPPGTPLELAMSVFGATARKILEFAHRRFGAENAVESGKRVHYVTKAVGRKHVKDFERGGRIVAYRVLSIPGNECRRSRANRRCHTIDRERTRSLVNKVDFGLPVPVWLKDAAIRRDFHNARAHSSHRRDIAAR